MRTVNIIDADSIAYASAAQAELNTIIVKNSKGKTKEFKNVTELKNLLKEKNKLDLLQTLIIEPKRVEEPVEFALYNVKCKIERIKEAVPAGKVIIVLGGKATYRQSLPLPTPYKNNRDFKPVHLKACKDYLLKNHGAYLVDDIEADDEVSILAEEYKKKKWKVFLSSLDHDSFQLENITIFNYKEQDLEKAFIKLSKHSFNVIKKNNYIKSVGSGVGYLAGQLLYGDPTDTYNPTEIAGIKYGVMSAYKDLQGCKTPKNFLSVVKRKYQEWYKQPVTYTAWDGSVHTKDWKSILQMYFTCVKMLRYRGDTASVDDFFNSHGVIL